MRTGSRIAKSPFQALNAIDAAQTCQFIGSGRGSELNPLLGKHPSCPKVIGFKLATGVIHYLIADHLNDRNPKAAKVFQIVSIVVQAGASPLISALCSKAPKKTKSIFERKVVECRCTIWSGSAPRQRELAQSRWAPQLMAAGPLRMPACQMALPSVTRSRMAPIERLGAGTYNSGAGTLTRTLTASSTGSLISLSGAAKVSISALSADFASVTAPVKFDTAIAGTWIIPHGLGRRPLVQVFLNSGEQIFPDVFVDTTNITAVFSHQQQASCSHFKDFNR
jgi:hypothetical protein